MPFKTRDYSNVYTAVQLKTLQKIYDEVCEIINYYPASEDAKNKIALMVIKGFNKGITNPVYIVKKMTNNDSIRYW